jgi:hypothetical protein
VLLADDIIYRYAIALSGLCMLASESSSGIWNNNMINRHDCVQLTAAIINCHVKLAGRGPEWAAVL